MTYRPFLAASVAATAFLGSIPAYAQNAPPPDATALVKAPDSPASAPSLTQTDGTNFNLSAGGVLTTGNSRLLAMTANGNFNIRRGADAFGAALLANYGQGAPPNDVVVRTAENVQGRIRYDRYVLDRMSIFLIGTGRHDYFQGLAFRLNIDPGVKYLFVDSGTTAFWGEFGYDHQYDVRLDNGRYELDAMNNPVLDSNGNPILALPRTATDHSLRLFAGVRHAFNKEVTISAGLEYLQSIDETTKNRINFDALFAAKVSGGLAVGIGYTARYDHDPLPGKKTLDTSTTVSLIYAFTDPAPAAAAPVVCPPPPPPCPQCATFAPVPATPSTPPPVSSTPGATLAPSTAPQQPVQTRSNQSTGPESAPTVAPPIVRP